MPVLSDIKIDLNAREVVLALHQGRKAPPELIDQTQEIIEQYKSLLHPLAIYKWVRVLGVNGEKVLLDTGRDGNKLRINIGPHCDLMSKAELALVSVVTIGGELDECVRDLNKSDHILEAYLLDSVGVVALAQIEEVIRSLAEKEAKSRGWGVGYALAPGSLRGWPLEGQADLCGLLPLEQINVRLSDSNILIPFKSASGIIGIGPNYQSKKVESICQFCTRADTCWQRRK